MIDISTVLAELRPDEVLPENVAQRVQLPKNARVDDRQRIILIDGDFEALIACPDVHAELHTVPPPRFQQATTDAERRQLIQSSSDQLRPADFHSFRRAYNTALADANLNVQTAMRLAGPRNDSTHMRYVMRTGRFAAPTAALPTLPQFRHRPCLYFREPQPAPSRIHKAPTAPSE